MSDSREFEHINISVIVPCYNSNLEWLASCLVSITRALSKHSGNAEVLVVDDGSDFLIENEIRPLIPIETLQHLQFCRKANGGLSSARNFGIRLTRGEWCHFIDDDDLIHENFYRDMTIQAVQGNANLIFAESRFFGELEERFRIDSKDIASQLVIGNIVHVNAVLSKRSLLEQAGLFDEKLNGLEDWDMWLKCFRSGANFQLINRQLALVRVHSNSMSTNRRRMNSRMADLVFREWQEHFDFWIGTATLSNEIIRAWGLAGMTYSLRSETPWTRTFQFRKVVSIKFGSLVSWLWLFRQSVKHVLKTEVSPHSLP